MAFAQHETSQDNGRMIKKLVRHIDAAGRIQSGQVESRFGSIELAKSALYYVRLRRHAHAFESIHRKLHPEQRAQVPEFNRAAAFAGNVSTLFAAAGTAVNISYGNDKVAIIFGVLTVLGAGTRTWTYQIKKERKSTEPA